MRLLKIPAADLGTGNLSRNCEHGNPVPMAIVEAVDEVKIARPATAGTDGKLAGQVSLCAGCKSSHLFMAHMHPLNVFVSTDGIGQSVQGMARHAIDAFHARVPECFDKYLSHFLRHMLFSPRFARFGSIVWVDRGWECRSITTLFWIEYFRDGFQGSATVDDNVTVQAPGHNKKITAFSQTTARAIILDTP